MKPRSLRRSGREMAPLLWEWTAAADPKVVREAMALGATWFHVSEAVPAANDIKGANIVLGIPGEALLARRGGIVHERLRAMGRSRCAGVMIQKVSPGEIKAGGPFHRLSQLRDQGTIELFFAEAEDYATAEWLLHHTPVHAIALSYSLHDLTARHRLLRDALGFGTGIIARPGASVWRPIHPIDEAANVSYLAGEAAVTSVLLPIPRTVDDLLRVIAAVENPMPERERERWWQAFSQQVAEPPPPPRGVAPDFA